MTTPDRLRTALAIGALAGALSLAGCSSSSSDVDDDAGGSTSSADRGIDASQYADTYDQDRSDAYDQSASSAGAPVAGSPSSPGTVGPLENDTFVDHGMSGYVDAEEDPEST